MDYYYTYRVKFYDSFDEKELEKSGVTYGATYSEAVNRIADYYGDDDIIEVTLRAIDANFVLEMSNETIEQLQKMY